MASSRRIGAESSLTRAALLDAAEQLMLEEGYAAVTSRRVASRAELKPQLVHYYFRTMDDLYLEVFRRRAEQGLERQADALASPQPLRALWAFSNEGGGTALTMEFAALARHRPAIRAEVGGYAEQFRIRQLASLSDALAGHGIDPDELPPVVLLVFMTSLSRMLVMEEGLDMSIGHAETRSLIERWLTEVEGPAR
ncbi:TetR/AcrR family transcriptional regulator [Aquihabitans sp. McL0605]|uniref:TetR/AcrR family transcriptional regulator n=1 Tax=Aquihabitans sp. McL0605 TaxID=3415671 RepID=UPI003CED6CFA